MAFARSIGRQLGTWLLQRNRAARSWLGKAWANASAGTPPSAAAQPKRLDLAEQWNRLAGVLTTAIDGASSVRNMQFAATQQLDLAQYGITTLIDELTAVMTVPGRHARVATIHALAASASPKPAARHALAA